MKIQINTLLHQGAFLFSLPKLWEVAAAHREASFDKSPWASGGPHPAMLTPNNANTEGGSILPSVTLTDFVNHAQMKQRVFHWAQSPNPYFAKRNNFLNHQLILWWVSWSTLLSLSSPTHNLGVLTGKRTSEKHSKFKSQENPIDFQCFVLHCHQSCWEIKNAADLGTSYGNFVKMPFKVHAKNEAFCCNKSSSKWSISEGVHLAELW